MYISITWNKVENESEQLNNLLDNFENNPFLAVDSAEFGFENLKKYNREEAIRFLLNGEDKTVKVEKLNPEYARGTITTDVPTPFVDFVFADSLIKTEKDLTKIIGFAQKWIKLEGFLSIAVSADDRENDFWIDVAHTEPLAECFGSRLGWYHIISPFGYKPFFNREDLLNAPAFAIEELEDGTICFQSYENPLDFSKSETTEKIIEITNYLNAKWQEHDSIPTVDVIDDVIVFKQKK